METRGVLTPDTITEARTVYDESGPVAQTVVREVARAMDLDREEYRKRVTPAVVETARDAIFAGMLQVSLADRETFTDWRATHPGAVTVAGHEEARNVVWHVGPDERAVAATYNDEPDAAVSTLRRQAFGRLYRDYL